MDMVKLINIVESQFFLIEEEKWNTMKAGQKYDHLSLIFRALRNKIGDHKYNDFCRKLDSIPSEYTIDCVYSDLANTSYCDMKYRFKNSIKYMSLVIFL